MTDEEITGEYWSAVHAMQAGVAYEQGRGSTDGTPKHLRVGVNVAMVDHGALVRLLVAKGVITHREYLVAIRDAMKAEVEAYEKRALEQNGVRITFA